MRWPYDMTSCVRTHERTCRFLASALSREGALFAGVAYGAFHPIVSWTSSGGSLGTTWMWVPWTPHEVDLTAFATDGSGLPLRTARAR
jgi:hypothetical protein